MRLDRDNIVGARLNNKDVKGMRINGHTLFPIILYDYIEFTIDNTGALAYKSEVIESAPKVYDSSFLLTGDKIYDKEEITLLDGSVTRKLSTTCDKVDTVKLWYPEDAKGLALSSDLVTSINHINTDNFTNMSHMFEGCCELTSINLNDFNTSKVRRMDSMFCHCYKLTSLDLSNFDTSQVTDMHYMFWKCTGLESINLSNWDVSNVTDITYMFKDCSSLKTVDLSGWYVKENCSYFGEMFTNCTSLEVVDLRNFDVSHLGSNYYRTFINCPKLHTIRLDNCNADTLKCILDYYSGYLGLPTGTITDSGGNIITRKIYCKRANASKLSMELPDGWQFEYID